MSSSFIDWWLQFSPFQRYPVESLVISITFFCISLWALGSRINKDIAQQLAIPLVKEIKDMGFNQLPAFNTLSHPMRRGYIALPSLDGDRRARKERPKDQQNGTGNAYPTIPQLGHYLWSETYSSHHLYASGHEQFKGIHVHIQTIPRHDILMQVGSFLRIVPNKDTVTLQIAFKYLEPFFWSLSRDKDLSKKVMKDWNDRMAARERVSGGQKGAAVKKTGDDDHDGDDVQQQKTPLLPGQNDDQSSDQDGSNSGSDEDDDDEPLLGSSFAAHGNSKPQQRKSNATKTTPTPTTTTTATTTTTPSKNKPELITNTVDFGGLTMTHALTAPNSEYVITTDTPDLIHTTKFAPCNPSLTNFFLNLATNTKNAFEFISLEISDQSESYDTVKYTDIPVVADGAGDDVDFDEESALVTLVIGFNFDNVPRIEDSEPVAVGAGDDKGDRNNNNNNNNGSKPAGADDEKDYNNQAFVNTWMTQIGATLFAIAYEMLTYRLPQNVKRHNIKMRDSFDPGTNLRNEPTTQERRRAMREEKEAREGMSNSIIGSGNFKKRNVGK